MPSVNRRSHASARALKRFAEYCATFGLVHGGSNFLRAKWPSQRLVELRTGSNGTKVRARGSSTDISVFEQVFVGRDYEFDYDGIQPKWIIDGGANVGFSAVYFAERFPDAIVAAIEPDPTNFGILLVNVARFKNVVPLHAALWSEPARMQISNPAASPWAFQVEIASGTAGKRTIPALTVPQVMERIGADRIDILKLDVEGAEHELFRSCPQWLGQTRFIAIELHDDLCRGSSRAFYNALAPYEFSQVSRGENLLVRIGR
jgi:FkbM family methyltransferase